MKTIRGLLLIAILSVLLLSGIEASHTSPRVRAFAGKGVWINKIWELPDNLDRIIERLTDARVNWVAIKFGDSDSYWVDRVPSLAEWLNQYGGIVEVINQFHNAGIRVIGWQYIYSVDFHNIPNATETDVGLQILSIPWIDGLIIDAECEYEEYRNPKTCQYDSIYRNKASKANQYMQAIRVVYPNAPIAYSSFFKVEGHEWFPWPQFGRYSDVNIPQVYWAMRNSTVSQDLSRMKTSFDNWHQIWEDRGYGDSVKPIMPVGQGGQFEQGRDIYSGEIATFCNQVRSYSYAGTNLFRYGVMDSEAWDEYSLCSNEYLLASLRAEPEQGFSPLPVTLIVESASNVSGTMNFSLWWHCEYRGVSVAEAEAICGELPRPSVGTCSEGMRGVKCEAVYPLTLSISHTYEHEGIYFPKVIVEQGTWAIEDRTRVLVSSLNTPTPFQTPTTPTKTSTVPSTSTVTVSPGFTNTPPASTTPTATSLATSTKSPTPSPDPSLTPGAISIVAVWTTNESNLLQSLFARGESIRYWFETEAQAQLQGVRSDWLVQGACGPILSETWSLNIPQARSRLALQRSIPEDACLGAYVFQLTLIYNNQTISKATSFSVVAQTATPSSTSPATTTPSATSSPSATSTPEPTVTPGQTPTPPICYDFNGDGIVDMDDVQLVATSWRAPNSAYDLNEDNQVTIQDIMLVAKSWGDVCPRTPTATVSPSSTPTCCAPPPTPPPVVEPSPTCACPGPPTEVPVPSLEAGH